MRAVAGYQRGRRTGPADALGHKAEVVGAVLGRQPHARQVRRAVEAAEVPLPAVAQHGHDRVPGPQRARGLARRGGTCEPGAAVGRRAARAPRSALLDKKMQGFALTMC